MNPDDLSLVEDASLNASAPPQQRWFDGWLVRFSPGKAQRARSVQAVAAGRLPMAAKLRAAQAVYREAGLPMLVRITPFSQPAGLDAHLAEQGWSLHDPTLVMVCPALASLVPAALPPHFEWLTLNAADMACAVGALRGSPPEQQQAQAQRLEQAPVPFFARALRHVPSGQVAVCGQTAREGEFVGLYDVFTAPAFRRQGLARALCTQLLVAAREQGARMAYLQVSADNEAALAVYRQLGFVEGYRYHYRIQPQPI